MMKTPGKKAPPAPAARKNLDFRETEADLAEVLSLSQVDLSPDHDESIFHNIIRHADCGLDPWLWPAFWEIERKVTANDAEGAISDALDAIVKLARMVKIVGVTIPACYKRISHSVRVTEATPKARERKSSKTQARKKKRVAEVRKWLQEHPTYSEDYACHVIDKRHRNRKTGKPQRGWSYGQLLRDMQEAKKPSADGQKEAK
jgi:predicted RNA-binding protein with RPS1 domain